MSSQTILHATKSTSDACRIACKNNIYIQQPPIQEEHLVQHKICLSSLFHFLFSCPSSCYVQLGLNFQNRFSLTTRKLHLSLYATIAFNPSIKPTPHQLTLSVSLCSSFVFSRGQVKVTLRGTGKLAYALNHIKIRGFGNNNEKLKHIYTFIKTFNISTEKRGYTTFNVYIYVVAIAQCLGHFSLYSIF